uniref:MIP19823p n=1 Tax=Drosophila melanogaster TaxID=7227 RepID=D5A7K4_DROME|nr:MIP19823p [Drosophila melanogaster]
MRKCRKMSLFRAHGTLHLILGSSAHPLIRSSSAAHPSCWWSLDTVYKVELS